MNDEVKLILTKLKIVSEEKENGAYICDREHSELLLSYIEQLEKRNKELYEGFMATQEELTDYATKNEQLENLCNKYEQEHKTTFEIWKEDIKKSKQLENNRDKAIEYVEHHKFNKFGDIDCNEAEDIIDILKGGSDE